MTDQLFMEDLIARIRSLVRTDAKERPATASALDQVLARLRQQLPATTPHLAPVYRVVAAVPTHDLHGMRVEMEACVSAAERVGELTPRHPGFWNDRIQSVKKLMRRSLGWYTRPLRLFHGAVIRALQQMAAALEKQ